jgi:hypothetical protein
MYKLGVSDALARLGLTQPEESHLGRNLAVGGLAAAPFAGLIGRQKLIHDPHAGAEIARAKTLHDLSRQARAGDVLVAGRPKWTSWKLFQTPITGSPFYHADQVVAPGRYFLAGERYIDPADFTDKKGVLDKARYEAALKHQAQLSPRRAIWQASNIADYGRHGYEDVVLLRPKEPLTPAQLAAIKREAAEGARLPYKMSVGTKSVAKEIFVPKLNLWQKLRNLVRRNKPVVCQGNVCSTFPAQALQDAGIVEQVVRGKAPPSVLTADYLRSGAFEPVTHWRSPTAAPEMSAKALRRLGLGVRGALGLGLAGTAYGLSEDPLLSAGLLGTAATPTAVRALLNLKKPGMGYETFRPLSRAMSDITRVAEGGKDYARGLKGLKRIGGRTIPLALAGGLATYLGAKGIQKAIQNE